MTNLVPVVNQDFSVNHEATITDSTGKTVSAKDVILAEAPAVKMGLDAAQALSKNFIVKMAIGLVESAFEALVLFYQNK